MKVTIKVTQEHIDKGCRRAPKNCAVALALEDASIEFVHCCPNGIAFNAIQKDYGFGHWFSPEHKKWLLDFDKGYPVSPFSFELEMPVLVLGFLAARKLITTLFGRSDCGAGFGAEK